MVSLPNYHETCGMKLSRVVPMLCQRFDFHPEDVDSLWERLKDKVPIVYPH